MEEVERHRHELVSSHFLFWTLPPCLDEIFDTTLWQWQQPRAVYTHNRVDNAVVVNVDIWHTNKVNIPSILPIQITRTNPLDIIRKWNGLVILNVVNVKVAIGVVFRRLLMTVLGTRFIIIHETKWVNIETSNVNAVMFLWIFMVCDYNLEMIVYEVPVCVASRCVNLSEPFRWRHKTNGYTLDGEIVKVVPHQDW